MATRITHYVRISNAAVDALVDHCNSMKAGTTRDTLVDILNGMRSRSGGRLYLVPFTTPKEAKVLRDALLTIESDTPQTAAHTMRRANEIAKVMRLGA